jgi:hypothetical protein
MERVIKSYIDNALASLRKPIGKVQSELPQYIEGMIKVGDIIAVGT